LKFYNSTHQMFTRWSRCLHFRKFCWIVHSTYTVLLWWHWHNAQL